MVNDRVATGFTCRDVAVKMAVEQESDISAPFFKSNLYVAATEEVLAMAR